MPIIGNYFQRAEIGIPISKHGRGAVDMVDPAADEYQR